jgi:AAA-like domain
MVESAQVFKGVHDIPVYTNILFDKPLRRGVAICLYGGGAATIVVAALLLSSGHARSAVIYGALITAAATGIAALMPRGRPTLAFRLRSWWRTLRPQLTSSTDSPLLAPPDQIVGNLTFSAHGVHAHYLISGLPYYLQSTKRRIGVADRHQTLARELPAGTWAFGLSVPQSQRRLLNAMLRGHADREEWDRTCRRMKSIIADVNPRHRVYWLAIPVDAGRAGHSPLGHATKLRDWVAGRDKDSDTSVAAYQQVANDVVTALPVEFDPEPASEEMIFWFWRRNAWRGVFDNPLPRRRSTGRTQLPVAMFDEGNQHHHIGRFLPLRVSAAVFVAGALLAAGFGFPGLAMLATVMAAGLLAIWALGIRRVPSFRKVLRVTSPDGVYPDSYQALLPVVDMPASGIQFPGSEFLQALDDLDTGAVFDFAVNLVTLSREWEFTRNDRAKGNIDDQYEQRLDVRNGDAQLRVVERQLAEYNRQLQADIDERPLQAPFLVAVGAADESTLDHSVKRLKEELSGSGQIAIRHYRGAQTRLLAAFNFAASYKTGLDQFAHPTTTKKWSRFVPFTSSMIGNDTGILLGFNNGNTLRSSVLIDLQAASRRNHVPCLICGGAPGYGKSFAAKRIVRGEFDRGAQVLVIDPGLEWARAFADVPDSRKAVIDMAGNQFSADPLRMFPFEEAGGYWIDYMVPMTRLDAKSPEVRRLRVILRADNRCALHIDSTPALMRHIADSEDPVLLPVLEELQSWETYDFTRAIFDESLPVPDLANLDLSIWLTKSLDLPTAKEMADPHRYADLSERKRASIALYGMVVRLARITFMANTERFGLIVLEEAGGLLNSTAGAHDVHLISRKTRHYFTGLVIITQNPVKDLALMGDEFITQQLIVPFEKSGVAREVARNLDLNLNDYDEIEQYFIAQPSVKQMRDPTAGDDDFDDTNDDEAPDRGDRVGLGFFVDEFQRKAPIWVAPEPDPALYAAYDTTPGRIR